MHGMQPAHRRPLSDCLHTAGNAHHLFLLLIAVQLDVLVNLGLLSLLVWEYVCLLSGTKPADTFGLRQYGIRMEDVVPAAFAGECCCNAGLLADPRVV
jgi:hypothetical protein